LEFARRQPLAPTPINVNSLVLSLSEFIWRTLGEDVELEVVGSGGLWQVEADQPELESAVLNLVVNARDAMPNGGKLSVETSNAFLDETYCRDYLDVLSGQYVLIAVTDTGKGMDKETRNRAFEPFFTTKEAGQGTGLGLSQVYGFVKQSCGHVKIYSEPGEGTTVKIYLPRLMRDTPQAAPPPLEVPGAKSGETILVVEDDPDVRSYVVEVLRQLKYRVLEAKDAPSALAMSGPVDLLLTDVVLPKMNGRLLSDAMRAQQPNLRVLFMTGYSRNAIVHQGRLDPGVDLIQKPLSQAMLAAKVRAVLDAGK
ncbi:MAG: ATP-binding protein, partial [Xanthobacteraceae bacterium]